MNQKTVTLNTAQKLLFEWGQNWTNLTIHLDEVLIGTIPDRAALHIGRRFTLPDGKQILVMIDNLDLEVWYEGKELINGATKDTTDGFGIAWKVMAGMGVLQFILGAIYLATGGMRHIADVIFMAFAGIIMLGLSIWAKNSGSTSPFWFGIVFCWLSILLRLLMGSYLGIIIQAILLYFLYRGTRYEPIATSPKRGMQVGAPLDRPL